MIGLYLRPPRAVRPRVGSSTSTRGLPGGTTVEGLTRRQKRSEPLARDPARLARRPEEQQTTFLDLFLDLVFVFALLQLSLVLRDRMH